MIVLSINLPFAHSSHHAHTYPSIHSLIHSFVYSFKYEAIALSIHPLIHPALCHPLSFIYPSIQPFLTNSSIHLCKNSLANQLPIRPFFIHQFILHQATHSFIHPPIHSLIHASMHSATHSSTHPSMHAPMHASLPHLDFSDTVSGQFDVGEVTLAQTDSIHCVATNAFYLLAHFGTDSKVTED